MLYPVFCPKLDENLNNTTLRSDCAWPIGSLAHNPTYIWDEASVKMCVDVVTIGQSPVYLFYSFPVICNLSQANWVPTVASYLQ